MNQSNPSIAIACGGTGGHLFPGLAVAEKLLERDCRVTLMISPKEVDQQAVKNLSGMDLVTLPAVGLQRGSEFAFVRGLSQSWKTARGCFKASRPNAVVAMGGFTSAAPILAGKTCGARTFLHESNTIPGRANRWLSRFVNGAFVGFPTAAARLKNSQVTVTGTPVRPCFGPRDSRQCRLELGLDPSRPVILVVGGSQGASGINRIVLESLPLFAKTAPQFQWIHLAGPNDAAKMAEAYNSLHLTALVHSFFNQMDRALGAATVAISRAGASSLAELAATRLPSILIPYPVATDDHQRHNALAFVETGAARLLEQKHSRPEILLQTILDMVTNPTVREQMQQALALWQRPNAAGEIAGRILNEIGANIRPIASPVPDTRAAGRVILLPPKPVAVPAAPAVISSTVAEEVAL